MEKNYIKGVMAKSTVLCCILVFLIFANTALASDTGEWLSIENEYFIVYYKPGYESDARKILEYGNFAREVVLAKLPFEPDIKVAIYIYEAPGPTESSQYITWGLTMADYIKGAIYVLAPSEAIKQSSYYDDLWYKGNVIHEYVHIVIGRYLYSKGLYMGNCLPYWFSEGIAEYFKIFCSTPEIMQKYEAMLDRIRQMVKRGDGYLMSVTADVYYGGAYIVKYMYDTYGEEAMMNLFEGLEKDVAFAKALERALEVTPRRFEDNWLLWACEQFGVDPGLYEFVSDGVYKKLYKDLLAKYNDLNNTYTVIKSEHESLKAEYDELSKAHMELNASFYELKTAYEELVSNYTSLLRSYVELESNYKMLRTKYENLSSNYTALESEYESLKAEYSELSKTHRELNASFHELKSDYRKLVSSYANLQRSYDQLLSRYVSLNSTYNELKSDLSALQAEYQSLKSKYQDLKSTYEAKEVELDNTRKIMYLLAGLAGAFMIATIYLAKTRKS